MYATGLYCPQKDPERRRRCWDIVDLKIKCVVECERVNEREREKESEQDGIINQVLEYESAIYALGNRTCTSLSILCEDEVDS